MLLLRDEMEQLKRGNKRGLEAVTEKSPAEPVHGKSKQGEEGQTPAEWAKLAEAYRRMRDEKDRAEREVSASKERINRIKIMSPSSSRKKLFGRRKSLKGGCSPIRKDGDQVKITFVRKVGEEKEAFCRRVNNDLGKLRKAQFEALCKDEGIEYGGVKKTAGDLADIYTARAYQHQANRRLAENDEEEHEEEDLEEGESADVAGASTDYATAAESPEGRFRAPVLFILLWPLFEI
ncbi:hypothetical protein CBR_g52134 [Chara braunii]|uniref:Uncharacterized protein n=1 Tax=Chara braunii TaxID=69332 RepID=A0A388M9J6_CHABU|nr:hypothetical protein CBR_g52134 [Chara braunii]|eukprot:GBG91248.1 hypothetical protein CBR_g52134 [Chara braunii]